MRGDATLLRLVHPPRGGLISWVLRDLWMTAADGGARPLRCARFVRSGQGVARGARGARALAGGG